MRDSGEFIMVNKKTLHYLILLLIVVAPLYSLGLANHGLWSADEPRVAEIGREMSITGNWAVPTLNQRPFLEEPPLYYGSLALVYKAFGRASDGVARIPSAVFGFAGVLAVFFIANFLFGPRVALFSGLILATAGEYFRVAHWVIVDGALTFFVISAMGLFITGYHSEAGRKKLVFYVLLYIACSLAFYVKGFIGLAIPGLGILAFLATERNFKELIRMRLWLGVLIFLVMVLPWFLALWQQGGTEFLKVFLLHNHLQRFLPSSMAGSISGAASGHHHPFYYYITEFPSGFLPWSIFLIPTLYLAFSKTGLSHTSSPKGRLFAKCWFFAGIIFLSVASTKRTLYLMPIFAPFAMLTGLYIDYTIDQARGHKGLNRIGKVFMWMFGILLLVIGLGLTPTYFYLKQAYLPEAPASLPFLTILASMLLTAFSSGALRYLITANMKRYWMAITVPIICMLLFTLVVFVPILDRHKSFVPFCRQIVDTVPAGTPLYAYQPDETLRGAVPFYTGRYVIETGEVGSDVLKGREPFYIMIRDRRKEYEKDLLATGQLFVLIKQEMGSDRALVLLSNGAAQSTPTIGDLFRKNTSNTIGRRFSDERPL